MEIIVTTGLGSGPTTLSAFDAALNDAAVANYNLIRLSSVIPPKTTINIDPDKVELARKLPGSWGDRLYVVMAEQREDTPNTEAWAGIGWVQEASTGKGLFVEHEGGSKAKVTRDITQSLQALMATRNVDFGEIHMRVVGRTCTNHPICAMVLAVYQVSDWNNAAHFLGEVV